MELRAGVPEEQVPPGIWPAVVTRIEDGGEGQYGPMLKWTFQISTSGGVVTSTGITGQTVTSPKAKASKFVAALIGRYLNPGETINTEILVGRSCQVVVEPNAESGFNNIVGLVAASPAPAATAPSGMTLGAGEAPQQAPTTGGMPF